MIGAGAADPVVPIVIGNASSSLENNEYSNRNCEARHPHFAGCGTTGEDNNVYPGGIAISRGKASARMHPSLRRIKRAVVDEHDAGSCLRVCERARAVNRAEWDGSF
ncbi:hypothetical protein F2P81_005414 [Scophthalmus maximus]|uniref:Uncharacterized protein n=1 Tax=Scophthalmus maximus TaxID=52904 RepID=A0A6A4TIK9_SCOMX|nr:hypothetical protein F2P81_005414 [Scophthalmus maximus]